MRDESVTLSGRSLSLHPSSLNSQERTDDHDAETDTGAGRGDEHSEEDGRLPRGALRLPFGAAHAALLPDAARLPLLRHGARARRRPLAKAPTRKRRFERAPENLYH